MTDSVKCCCTFAFCAMTGGLAALAEDHGGGGSSEGASPVVRPLATDTEQVKTKFEAFGKSLVAGSSLTTAEKEKAAFDVLRIQCGYCHGPGKQYSSPAVFRVGKDGRPLDPNGATYLRVMLAAVQNLGTIMPPQEKLDVEDKRVLAAWLATEGVFPRKYRNPQDIPRPPHIGPNPPRQLFVQDRVLSGGRQIRLSQRARINRPSRLRQFRRSPRFASRLRF